MLSKVDEDWVSHKVRILMSFARARCEAEAERWTAAAENLSRARELAQERPELGRLLGRIAEYESHLRSEDEG